MEASIVPSELMYGPDLERPHDRYWETNLYPIYRDIVRRVAPSSILEIGVRFGYSFAVALDATTTINRAIGIDMGDGVQQYGGQGDAFLQAVSRLSFMQETRWPHVEMEFYNQDTQKTAYLPFYGKVDLAYIDGDHSPEGCLHDLMLTLPKVTRGGSIVVDDIDHHPELRQPVMRFADYHDLKVEYLPDASHRGRFLLTLKG